MAPTSIQRLITEVNEDLKGIEKQILQVNYVKDEPVGGKDIDSRIVDLQRGRANSSIAKFRRGLSQRSLAIQFNEWELATYKTSEIRKRASRPAENPARKLGRIAKFLQKHRFRNGSAARHGIEHGMKLLICEKLLNGTGISAILIFKYAQLRILKFSDLSGLRAAIENATNIKELLNSNVDWIDRCQKCYDSK